MWQFWIIVSSIFFILEMITVGFLLFWFGIGALFALITCLFTTNLVIQTSVFVISSGLLVLFTRKFANKVYNKENISTNAFSIIGKSGLVIEEIDPILGKGKVKIGTEIWSAKSSDDTKIEKGIEITVLKIDGVKAIVK